MHLDDELVQRLVDGEVDATAVAGARAHLDQCAGCRALVERAAREEAELRTLLARVDDPAPRVAVEEVIGRASARTPEWLRRAAVIVAALGVAGIAYAVPGSPVPAWVGGLVARSGTGDGGVRPTLPTEPLQTPDPITTGVAVAPGQSLVVQFASYQVEGRIRVSITDGVLAELRAIGGTVTFGSEVERLTVANQGSGADYEIAIPRGAPQVEIRIGDRLILRKQGDRLTAVAEADPDGRYLLPLQAPTP